MDGEVLLNAYLDLNLLLVAGVVIWSLLRWAVMKTRLGSAYLPQLRLLNGLTVLLVASPLLALMITTWIVAHPPNIPDLLVRQYLHGNVGLSASQFEALLGLREDMVRALLAQHEVWTQVVAVAFLAGALFCALHMGLSVLRLTHSLRGAHLWKRIGRVELLISDTARVAYSTRGVRNRYVVLPSALLEAPQDLRMTVAHELQHFRQSDIECEFLLELLRPLLFWNPAFFLWRRQVRMLREYACDQALMVRPHFDMRAYCECLIRACQVAAQNPVLFARTTPTVALVDRRETRRPSTLQSRIVALTATRQDTAGPGVWLLISGLLMASVLTTMLVMQRSSDWSHDRIMLSTIVNLERMAQRNATVSSPFQGGFVVATD